MSERELARALLLGKPYFGSAMAALQGPPMRHGVLDALLRTIARRKKSGPIRVLEVGSWAGASAITFCAALQSLRRKGEILCVDMWEPYIDPTVEKDPHYVKMTEEAEAHTIFRLFRHNLAACNVGDMVTWRVGNSLEVLPTLEPSTFDLIYIDGSHVYRHVSSDIANAKRLIAEGGIVAGDDLELDWNEVDLDSHSAALASDRDYVMDPRAMRSYHPGVTEAVHEGLPQASRFEGVWAATKNGDRWADVILPARRMKLPKHIVPFVVQENEQGSPIPPIEAVGESLLFNLARVGSKFVAIAKVLGPTALLSEKLGERELGTLVLRDSDLAQLRVRIRTIEAQSIKPLPELVRQVPHYNLIRLGERYVAVSITLGPMPLLAETIGESELGDLILLDTDLDRLESRVTEIAARIEAARVPATELLAETPAYNLIRAGDTYMALAKVLGPTALLSEKLGERELGTLVLRDSDLAQLRVRIRAIEAQSIKPLPELVRQVPHYNLIRLGERYVAVSTTLGPMPLLAETIGESELGDLILLDTDLDRLESRVTEIAARIEAARVPATELLAETPAYNLIRAGDTYMALAKVLGPTALLSEKLGERELGTLVLRDSDLAQLRVRIQAIEAQSIKPLPELVRQVPHYNLIRLGKCYVAVSTTLGPMPLLAETIGESELGDLILLDTDLDRLESRVTEIAARIEAARVPATELLAETPAYNLIRAGDTYMALAKVLGPTALLSEKLGERELGTLVLRDSDLAQLRVRIRAIEAQSIKPLPELVRQVPHYNLIRLGERYVAVSTTLGPMPLLAETIGESELGDLILLDTDLDRLESRVTEIAARIEAARVPATELLAETPAYNLIRAGDTYMALAKVLGPTALLSEKLGERELGTLVLRDSDLAQLRVRIQAIEAQSIKPLPELVRQVPHYNLIRLGERYVAVSTTLGPMPLLAETIGESELGDLILLDTDLDRLESRVTEIAARIEAARVPATELLAETPAYNLIRAGDTYMALAKVLGPTALLSEKLGERELGTLVLRDSDLAQLRVRIQAIEAQSIKPLPELVRQVPHYNLIRLGERYVAVSTMLGPTSLLVEKIGERELGELILLDTDLDHLEFRIAEIAERYEAV